MKIDKKIDTLKFVVAIAYCAFLYNQQESLQFTSTTDEAILQCHNTTINLKLPKNQ